MWKYNRTHSIYRSVYWEIKEELTVGPNVEHQFAGLGLPRGLDEDDGLVVREQTRFLSVDHHHLVALIQPRYRRVGRGV